MSLPFCQASENNKAPILDVLTEAFAGVSQVLEIGSGTGQHAVHFAPALPHLIWQTSDMPDKHPGITQWIGAHPSTNLKMPLSFEIGKDDWPSPQVDAVFTANTAHIMQVAQTKLMMELVANHLPSSGVFCQYGPFNLGGQYTSAGNARFDQQLQAEGYGGIRDVAELQEWAIGLTLAKVHQMPANNLLLVWNKTD